MVVILAALPYRRQNNLLGLAKRCGEHGYFLLYMCIRDSRAENRHGHGSAVAALETHGECTLCLCHCVATGSDWSHMHFLFEDRELCYSC